MRAAVEKKKENQGLEVEDERSHVDDSLSVAGIERGLRMLQLSVCCSSGARVPLHLSNTFYREMKIFVE